MLVPGPWLLLLMADCSTAAQDCPAGQVCVAVGARDNCPERGQCEPLPAAADIELSLPVAKGERVFCGADNLRRPGRFVHSACAPAERFGFSLASTAFEAPHVVVASADGVAYFWAGCATQSLTYVADPWTPMCNGGYGNHVRVQHTPDVYTQYQHLSAVLVNWGQPVKRGQPIGIEGNTGGAGAKHIHWSAHRGDAIIGGPAIPMSKIRFLGGTASSATLKCGWNSDSAPDPATAYVSDNEPAAPPEPLRWIFAPSKPPDPNDKSAPGLFARAVNNPQEKDAALTELRALPDVGINRYWLGAALHELKKNAEAEKVLRQQRGRSDLPPIYQQWTDLRLAELAAARGAKAQARALLEKCRGVNDRPDFKLRWDGAWARVRVEVK